jgi:hypothetical protein
MPCFREINGSGSASGRPERIRNLSWFGNPSALAEEFSSSWSNAMDRRQFLHAMPVTLNVQAGLIAGFIATVVLSILMIAKSSAGLMPQLNPIEWTRAGRRVKTARFDVQRKGKAVGIGEPQASSRSWSTPRRTATAG